MGNPQKAEHNASPTTDSTDPQALPSDWEELTYNDGRTFYANHATRSTSWQKPNAETGEDSSNIQEGLPPAWQALIDSEGKTYYANHGSNSTTFVRPEGLTGKLPAGWEVLCNPEGVAYFADHNTRTSTWRDSRDGVFE
jgi:E3 ubiquitin-protein ligase NEDD4